MDGPAFRVRSAGRAEVRYPVYRVSRVVASPGVEWSAAALRACLETGIPIVVVSEDGAPLGSMLPACPRVSRLSDELEELLDRPDWHEIYATWLRATRMRVLGEWRTSREAAGNPPAPGEFSELVRKHVYGTSDAALFEGACSLWRGAICALAAGVLGRAGLQAAYWGAGGTALRLLDDMSRVLELRLWLEVGGGMVHGLTGEAIMLRVFHAMSDKLDAQCGRVLASLARRVRQVLAEWR